MGFTLTGRLVLIESFEQSKVNKIIRKKDLPMYTYYFKFNTKNENHLIIRNKTVNKSFL